MRVDLTSAEMMLGAMVGTMRQVTNLRDKRTNRYGCDPNDAWTPHIEGACGELAVAKALGRFWSGAIGSLQADDVGPLQVRTRSRHGYELIIHPSDPDERVFVLVTGTAPTFHIRGWMVAKDGKREEWWADPSGKDRPAFFIPHKALHPFSTLCDRA